MNGTKNPHCWIHCFISPGLPKTIAIFTASIENLKEDPRANQATNSNISPGWQFNALQIASSVLKRTAFALPVFKMDRLDKVRSTFSESSFSDIFLLAI